MIEIYIVNYKSKPGQVVYMHFKYHIYIYDINFSLKCRINRWNTATHSQLSSCIGSWPNFHPIAYSNEIAAHFFASARKQKHKKSGEQTVMLCFLDSIISEHKQIRKKKFANEIHEKRRQQPFYFVALSFSQYVFVNDGNDVKFQESRWFNEKINIAVKFKSKRCK